ncbi:MAG: NEL-type E3 ubiquitin ligase domain-containing protein, partial [Gammaproteobacteria bacterium]
TGLTALPNNLSVGGTLNLSHCTSLTALPDDLRVDGNLTLCNCIGLTALPNNLRVSRILYLTNCTGLTALPDDLIVSGDLDLSGCMGLTALPNWIATLGHNENTGGIRRVYLTGTGLSETILNRLRDLGNPNVQFCFGHTAQEYQMFQSLHDALKSWDPEEMLQPLDEHSWNLNAEQEVQLMTFLSRLHQTADAKNCNTKPNLQHRVQSFLIQMEKNQDDYRNQALERIAEGLESCDDRVILIMNDIEKLTRIREASCSENPEASLRSLGQSLLALEVVHRHAAEKCKHAHFVDEIEVYLALEIKLADALNLPVSTKNMLFERCANLTEQEIAAARKEALATVNDPQKVKTYLESWEPWQTLQRTAQARQLSWSALPHSTASFDQSECCLISSRSLSELEDPVAVGQVLYSLESFLTWWVQQGTDPATKLKIDLSAIKAVPKLNR